MMSVKCYLPELVEWIAVPVAGGTIILSQLVDYLAGRLIPVAWVSSARYYEAIS